MFSEYVRGCKQTKSENLREKNVARVEQQSDKRQLSTEKKIEKRRKRRKRRK